MRLVLCETGEMWSVFVVSEVNASMCAEDSDGGGQPGKGVSRFSALQGRSLGAIGGRGNRGRLSH